MWTSPEDICNRRDKVLSINTMKHFCLHPLIIIDYNFIKQKEIIGNWDIYFIAMNEGTSIPFIRIMQNISTWINSIQMINKNG